MRRSSIRSSRISPLLPPEKGETTCSGAKKKNGTDTSKPDACYLRREGQEKGRPKWEEPYSWKRLADTDEGKRGKRRGVLKPFLYKTETAKTHSGK